VHPTPSPFVVFTFGLVVESIKELGDASISSKANDEFLRGVEALLHKYKYMFIWSYQNMKSILPSICEH
jgi:hypothetical protein